MKGQRIGYVRVSTSDQKGERQLENVPLDRKFEDKASGKDTCRPQLEEMMKFVRKSDIVIIHSMDRLARNLDDLRRIVNMLTKRGVCIEFVKESLTFSGDDTPLSILLLSVMGAFAEFERTLIRERQREGIAIAKANGRYRGGQPKLTKEQAIELKRRIEQGVTKTRAARDFKISRETVYQYLKSS